MTRFAEIVIVYCIITQICLNHNVYGKRSAPTEKMRKIVDFISNMTSKVFEKEIYLKQLRNEIESKISEAKNDIQLAKDNLTDSIYDRLVTYGDLSGTNFCGNIARYDLQNMLNIENSFKCNNPLISFTINETIPGRKINFQIFNSSKTLKACEEENDNYGHYTNNYNRNYLFEECVGYIGENITTTTNDIKLFKDLDSEIDVVYQDALKCVSNDKNYFLGRFQIFKNRMRRCINKYVFINI